MVNVKTVKVSLATWKALMALCLELENGKRLSMGEVIRRLLEFYQEHQENENVA